MIKEFTYGELADKVKVSESDIYAVVFESDYESPKTRIITNEQILNQWLIENKLYPEYQIKGQNKSIVCQDYDYRITDKLFHKDKMIFDLGGVHCRLNNKLRQLYLLFTQ